MEVGVREFRNGLKAWIERVQTGEEVVVTERGRPVARLVGIERSSTLQDLIDRGVISKPEKPAVSMRNRKRIRASGSVSELIKEQRR
ncbi:MAG: type II toxin-antitoxin system prevent-host-death family antitoxin [Actinobacteria bacterium]|nr:type II toxin-antitoxin system prevent-host-death family antitoxin [Actinomycetota bacterium]